MVRIIILLTTIVLFIMNINACAQSDLLKGKDLNIILISIDTLRADHLGCYGYGRPVSLNIDEFSEKCIVFENAYSHAPTTAPSHMSMFTSLYPMVHGVHLYDNSKGRVPYRLDRRIKTFAEYLEDNGYSNAAFTSGGQVSKEFGFDRGFGKNYFVAGWERGFEWIRNNYDRKFFVFLHTYAVHDPYQPPEPYYSMFNPGYKGKIKPVSEKTWRNRRNRYWENVDKRDPEDIKQLVALYDGAIRYTDEQLVKPLFDLLTELNLTGRTIMVFTSDHGEEFKEHGRFTHIQVYDELLHVPLLLYLPRTITMGIELKQRIDTQVRLIDLMPTLLELLEIPYNRDTIQGVSLTSILTGNSEKDRILYATKVSNPSGPPAKPRRETIRDAQYKLIHNPLQVHEQWELYDLENDQAEKHNIFDKESQNRVRLTQILENYIDENRTFKELMECQPVSSHFDDSTIEQLKELGYIQ